MPGLIGFTGHLIAGVWLGNDDLSPTKKATGGGLPVETWSSFMQVQRCAACRKAALPELNGGGLSLASILASPGPPSPPTPTGGRNGGAAVRPESGNGLDGWLLDRLFGGH